MMVFCCSVFHFPKASNTIIWHQSKKKKKAFNSLLICGLIDPPCFPTSLVCHAVGTSTFSGFVPPRLQLSRTREASFPKCLRHPLPVLSDSNTHFVLTTAPHAPSPSMKESHPNPIRIFPFPLLKGAIIGKKITSEKEFIPLLFRIVVKKINDENKY